MGYMKEYAMMVREHERTFGRMDEQDLAAFHAMYIRGRLPKSDPIKTEPSNTTNNQTTK